MRNRFLYGTMGVAVISALLSGCGSSAQKNSSAQTETVQEISAESEAETAAAKTAGEESIITNGGETIALSSLEHQTEDSESAVYYTSEISPQAMLDSYAALGEGLTGEHIAVKLSTGEPPASNYLDPDLIADLVHR